MDQTLKRISLMIREDQYSHLVGQGLNVSGLVRDLIDDHLSEHTIVLSVSEEVRNIYDQVIANTGSTDAELEAYLKEALKKVLKDKIKTMQALERKIN